MLQYMNDLAAISPYHKHKPLSLQLSPDYVPAGGGNLDTSRPPTWWIINIGTYFTFLLVVAPLVAMYYSSNNRPLWLATMELGRPQTIKDSNGRETQGPEGEGGAYQMIRLALEHLNRLHRCRGRARE